MSKNLYTFRGKSQDGSWHIGDLKLIYDGAVIISRSGLLGVLEIEYGVQLETVGQALDGWCCDVDGNTIFEDDIVDVDGKKFIVNWDNANFRFRLVNKDGEKLPINRDELFNTEFFCYRAKTLKIIGNIFDNPELTEDWK